MTGQESFKRRVRERMAKTGERYGAARRALVPAADDARRQWVSEPEMSEESIRRATGRGWDDWCDLIEAHLHEAGQAADDRHPALVAVVLANGVEDHWWAQAVVVGFERITGRRVLRVGMPEGLALFTLAPLADGRHRVTVSHSKLASPDEVVRWRAYWTDWLAAIDPAG